MGKSFGVGPNINGSFEASTDLSSYQFHIMKMSSGQLALATAATDLVLGVLQNKPDAQYEAAELILLGESKLVAGGSITAGQFLVSDGSGHAVAVTLSTATTNVAIGRALEDADSGDVFHAFINPGFVQV